MHGWIRRSRAWIAGWALWEASRSVLILILIVESIAVGVTVATAFLMPVEIGDVLRFVVLAACAGIAIELTRHIERRREHKHRTSMAYIDTKAVWSVAAVIVLPPVLASAMVVFTYALAWSRVRPLSRRKLLYRWIFSVATVLCGTQAAVAVLALGMHSYPGAPDSATLAGLADVGVIAVAATLRWAINAGLVMAAIALSKPTLQVRDLFTNFSEQMLEAGAMGLGLVAAVVVVSNPVALPGIVIAMVALHRGLLVHQYQQASRIDAKTGLATAGWWHQFAEHSLDRARDRGTVMGLLIVDLDHFKAINDNYGHPFGDDVLEAVAKQLLTEIRDQDACGRWGGEEFVVALPDIGGQRNLHHVAERLRRRIQSVALDPPEDAMDAKRPRITASLGGALYPSNGIAGLDELLLAADTALYAAKNAGRNTVRLSGISPDANIEQPRPAQNADHGNDAPPSNL